MAREVESESFLANSSASTLEVWRVLLIQCYDCEEDRSCVVQSAAAKRDCLGTDANGTHNYEHKGKSVLSVARCKRYYACFPGGEVHW